MLLRKNLFVRDNVAVSDGNLESYKQFISSVSFFDIQVVLFSFPGQQRDYVLVHNADIKAREWAENVAKSSGAVWAVDSGSHLVQC